MYHVLNVKSIVLESFTWFIFFVKTRVDANFSWSDW